MNIEEKIDKYEAKCKVLGLEPVYMIAHNNKIVVAGISSKATKVIIPNFATHIADTTFMNTDIQSVNIPNSIISIGERAFNSCKNLRNIDLPKSVNLKWAVFSSCVNLHSINMPDELEVIPDGTFFGCSKLKHVKTGKKLIKVEQEAFRHCVSLEKIDLSTTVTIGNRAFADCSHLKEVTFGKGLRVIEKEAFNSCFSLKSVTLPKNTTIGEKAFNTDVVINRMEV